MSACTWLLTLPRFATLNTLITSALLFGLLVYCYSPDAHHLSLDIQFPLADHRSANTTMSNHHGYRSVAYYVNWVRNEMASSKRRLI